MNNGIWNAVRRAARNVYPEGSADKMNIMPLTSLQPMPDSVALRKPAAGMLNGSKPVMTYPARSTGP